MIDSDMMRWLKRSGCSLILFLTCPVAGGADWLGLPPPLPWVLGLAGGIDSEGRGSATLDGMVPLPWRNRVGWLLLQQENPIAGEKPLQTLSVGFGTDPFANVLINFDYTWQGVRGTTSVADWHVQLSGNYAGWEVRLDRLWGEVDIALTDEVWFGRPFDQSLLARLLSLQTWSQNRRTAWGGGFGWYGRDGFWSLDYWRYQYDNDLTILDEYPTVQLFFAVGSLNQAFTLPDWEFTVTTGVYTMYADVTLGYLSSRSAVDRLLTDYLTMSFSRQLTPQLAVSPQLDIPLGDGVVLGELKFELSF